jgi:alpha-galactosidase
MTDEMLAAMAAWLPQYGAEPAAAAQRLAAAERDGTRVPLRDTHGAVRLHTHSVAEMALNPGEANANAGAADKGKMTKEPAAH